MASKKISQFDILPAVTPDTELPVIDPIDPLVNYRVRGGDFIAWAQDDGFYQLSGGEPYVDPTIFSPSPGAIECESVNALTELAGAIVKANNLTDGKFVVSDGTHTLQDASGISQPAPDCLDVADELTADQITAAGGSFHVSPSGDVDCNNLNLAGAFGAAALASGSITLVGAPAGKLLYTEVGSVISTSPGIAVDSSGNLTADATVTAATLATTGNAFTADSSGNVDCNDLTMAGVFSAPEVDSDLFTSSVFGMNEFLFANATGEIVTDANVARDPMGGIIVAGNITCDRLYVSAGLATIDDLGIITGTSLHADDGFNGTGTYTNFTIVDGIILAAS